LPLLSIMSSDPGLIVCGLPPVVGRLPTNTQPAWTIPSAAVSPGAALQREPR
jgi:hypothetical protein